MMMQIQISIINTPILVCIINTVVQWNKYTQLQLKLLNSLHWKRQNEMKITSWTGPSRNSYCIFLLHLRFKDFHFMFHYVQTIIGSKRVKYLTLLTLLDLTCNYNSKALEEFDINLPEGCLIVELNMQRNEMSSSIHSFVDFYALSKRSYSI